MSLAAARKAYLTLTDKTRRWLISHLARQCAVDFRVPVGLFYCFPSLVRIQLLHVFVEFQTSQVSAAVD